MIEEKKKKKKNHPLNLPSLSLKRSSLKPIWLEKEFFFLN